MPLARDRLRHHHVEGRQPIGGDDQQPLRPHRIGIAHLAPVHERQRVQPRLQHRPRVLLRVRDRRTRPGGCHRRARARVIPADQRANVAHRIEAQTPPASISDSNHRRTAQVLGALGEGIDLEALPIDGRFDRRVQDLDDQHQDHDGDQQDSFEQRHGKHQCGRHHHRRQDHLLAERVFVVPGSGQAVGRIPEGVHDAQQAALALQRPAVTRRQHPIVALPDAHERDDSERAVRSRRTQ